LVEFEAEFVGGVLVVEVQREAEGAVAGGCAGENGCAVGVLGPDIDVEDWWVG